MGDILRVWRKVFGDWKYLTLAVVTALLFYALNVFIANAGNVFSFYSTFGFFGTMSFFFKLAVGFGKTITPSSYSSLIAISFLFGILLSLVFFKIISARDVSDKKAGIWGWLGLSLGVLAPGCAACGIGLLSVLGLGSAFLTFFPLKGLEISILAIGLIGFSIFKISKDLTECKVCKISKTFKKIKV